MGICREHGVYEIPLDRCPECGTVSGAYLRSQSHAQEQAWGRWLRAALSFYADPAQWDGAAEAIWHDSGTRARAALRESPVPAELATENRFHIVYKGGCGEIEGKGLTIEQAWSSFGGRESPSAPESIVEEVRLVGPWGAAPAPASPEQAPRKENRMRTETFNAKHGFRFTRLHDGSVVVGLFLPPVLPEYPDEREGRHRRYMIFTDAEWASIVAHMTAEGGTSTTFAAAQQLHAGASPEQAQGDVSRNITQQLREAVRFLEDDVAGWLLALGADCSETESLHRHIEFYKLALAGAVSAPAEPTEAQINALINNHWSDRKSLRTNVAAIWCAALRESPVPAELAR